MSDITDSESSTVPELTVFARHSPHLDSLDGLRRPFLFHTGQRGALRTFGVLLYQPRHSADDLPAADVAFYARAALARPDAAARGKVAVLAADGLLVLQADAHGGLRPALCGNATAAAVLMLPQPRGQLTLIAPNGSRCIAEFSRSGGFVTQNWLIAAPTVAAFTWRGRTCVRIEGLNSYVVVTGDLPDDLPPEDCMAELTSGRPNAKMAVLARGATRAEVVFYNTSGRHGAAPFTGLANLAIAARVVPEVTRELNGPTVTFQTAQGPETRPMPRIEPAPGGFLRVALPKVEARLTPLLREVAQ